MAPELESWLDLTIPFKGEFALTENITDKKGKLLLGKGEILNEKRRRIVLNWDIGHEVVKVRAAGFVSRTLGYGYVSARETFETKFGDDFDLDVQNNLRNEILGISKKEPKRLEAIVDKAVSDFSLALTSERYSASINLLRNAIEAAASSQLSANRIIEKLMHHTKNMLSAGYRAFPEPLVQYETAKQIDGIDTYPHLVNAGIWSGLLKAICDGISEKVHSFSILYDGDVTDAILGGFVHDVWKVVDKQTRDIANSEKAPLSAEERKTINRHPYDGHRFLRPHKKTLGGAIMDAVLLHHVNKTGKSYPYPNKFADDIGGTPAIVSVGEKIDAISAPRKYHKDRKISVYGLADILVKEHMDKEAFICDAKDFEKYSSRLIQISQQNRHFLPLFAALKVLGQYDALVHNKKQSYN